MTSGPFGPGPYALEFERSADPRRAVTRKLGPYQRAAGVGQGLPVLFVCETKRAVARIIADRSGLPLLATTLEAAVAGPLTGAGSVWSEAGLRCGLSASPESLSLAMFQCQIDDRI